MKKIALLIFALLFLQSYKVCAQCNGGQVQIKVVLVTDQYPQETDWKVYDNNNNIILQAPAAMVANTMYMDSICVPANICYQFKITDQAGDGICCNYGIGHVEVYYGSTLIKRDSTYGNQSVAWMGCGAGQNCGTAISITQGFHTAPGPNTWYKFVPPSTGIYTVTTCGVNNICNTKLWMYDYCTNLQYSSGNAATIYYADNNCGVDATINAYLQINKTYYIRVGDENNSCSNTAINWEINFNGNVVGCLDTAACNFNPFATINDPASCIYYPNSNCPTGADLTVDSAQLSTTIHVDTEPSTDVCTVREGCMNGYGTRQLVRFDTKIANIGATDFYAGAPPSSPNAYSPIYEWDLCHGHWHFENYAEYLLADVNNDFVPIGYKNGFCVLDLTCTTGSPKFGCNNMGITSGCADIYSSYLDCQWIDITDIPDGNYKLILRANWVPRPDFYGRYEVSYTNNWARACITLGHNANNDRTVQVVPNCAPYIDCNGVENGLAVKDCDGNCNGTRLTGDLNVDHLRNANDVTSYMVGSIYHTLPATKCNDLNDDQKINVIDAALLFDCSAHGGGSIPIGHSHEPCRFPDKIKNPFQHADFSIGSIDYLAKTIDIFIKNPDSKVLGYQLKLKGVTLTAAQNTISTFTPQVQFRSSGEIIVLSNNEVPIPKNQNPVLAMRIQYSSIDSNKICIDSVIAAVNEAYEEIVYGTMDSVCITAIPTPNSINELPVTQNHILYPNPVHNSTTLFINHDPAEAFDVVICDIYGRTIRSYPQQKGNTLEIEKGSLNPGIYFLRAESGKWRFKEKMIIE